MEQIRQQLDSERDMAKLAKIAGGGLLVLYGLSRGTFTGMGLAAVGGGLLYSGQKKPGEQGQTSEQTKASPISVRHSVTIFKPVEEVFRRWRDLEHLPEYLDQDITVEETGEKTSHWFLSGPAGIPIKWNAEITDEVEDDHISWQSTNEAHVQHSGTVRFTPLPHNRGTEIHVALEYTPPGGTFGEKAARLLGDAPTQWVHSSLHKFKHLLETGVLPTTSGQPMGPTGSINVETVWGIARQFADAARTAGARKSSPQS